MNTFFSKDNDRKHTSNQQNSGWRKRGFLKMWWWHLPHLQNLIPLKIFDRPWKHIFEKCGEAKEKRWPCERNPCLLEDSDGWEMCKVYRTCSSGYSGCDSKLWWTNTVLKDWPWWRTTVVQMVHSLD